MALEGIDKPAWRYQVIETLLVFERGVGMNIRRWSIVGSHVIQRFEVLN
jgi:hypothetical protein